MRLQPNSFRYHNEDDIDLRKPKPELYAAVASFYPQYQAKEIARAFGVSVRTVRRAIAKANRYRFS